MKKLERIKIVWNRMFNKVFNVKNIEKLEAQKSEMEKVLQESKEELSKQKGKKKVIDDKIQEHKNDLEKLKETCKSIKEDEMMNKDIKNQKLKEGFDLYKKCEDELKVKEQQSELMDKLITQVEGKVAIYETKIDSLFKNINILKSKAEFTENVNDFKNVIKKLGCKDIGDIKDQIDADFYTSEFELNEISKDEINVEQFTKDVKDTGFGDFVDSL